jgi:hypothetical protein
MIDLIFQTVVVVAKMQALDVCLIEGADFTQLFVILTLF